MPDTHALLSASSSKQWLNCPPSARLQQNFPNTSSIYAEEGTFAHAVCEYKVNRYLHRRAERPRSDAYDTDEIDSITDVYAEFVMDIVERMRRSGSQPRVLVEERVNYSHIAPSGFGTADMLILGKDEDGTGVLHVCDFKTGKGVRVEADHNPQLMLYALGGLAAYGRTYPVETVRMSIIQPRLDNISTYEMSRAELEAWGESIRPIAVLAYEGRGEQKAGDWCRFCRAKPVCRACKEEALALCREEFMDLDSGPDAADSRDLPAQPEDDLSAPYEADRSLPVFRRPGLIPFSELEQILPTLRRISSWIDAVFAYVSSEAIDHGIPVKGYKVVEGRSKRIFTDPEAVEKIAVQHGYHDIYKQQMLSLTEFEKLMGRKTFAELLGRYVSRPPGRLALVPESDPRPPAETGMTAQQEFSALSGEE